MPAEDATNATVDDEARIAEEAKNATKEADPFVLTVLDTKHAHGVVGAYFNFNWTYALDDVNNFDTFGSKAVSILHCRDGKEIWSGEIIFWHATKGRLLVDSHGRRNRSSGPNQ